MLQQMKNENCATKNEKSNEQYKMGNGKCLPQRGNMFIEQKAIFNVLPSRRNDSSAMV
jgi:hypothetical protein